MQYQADWLKAFRTYKGIPIASFHSCLWHQCFMILLYGFEHTVGV